VVGGEVTLRVGDCQRSLAQHVEGIAVLLLFNSAGKRLRDRLAHDELAGEDAHRGAQGPPDHWLADATDECAE
jgi:hypothetical protein